MVLFFLILTLVFFLPAPLIAQTNPIPDACQVLNPGYYNNFQDNGPGQRVRGYVCFVVQDNPNLTGVLTIKNTSGTGDWDVLVGTDFDPVKKTVYDTLSYNNNSGVTDELVWLPARGYDKYYVVAYPRTSSPSKACLIFHQVNTNEILGEAIIFATLQSVVSTLLTPEGSSQSYKDNTSRAVAGGLSALQDNNLAAVGFDVALNEVSLQLSNLFGGGSWLFTFGVNYFGGFLKESSAFLIQDKQVCGH